MDIFYTLLLLFFALTMVGLIKGLDTLGEAS